MMRRRRDPAGHELAVLLGWILRISFGRNLRVKLKKHQILVTFNNSAFNYCNCYLIEEIIHNCQACVVLRCDFVPKPRLTIRPKLKAKTEVYKIDTLSEFY
jgi:hypothetical protein